VVEIRKILGKYKKAGVGYVLVVRSIAFAPHQEDAVIEVPLLSNAARSGIRTFYAKLASPRSSVRINRNHMEINIS
jgi:hypothetical protein